MEGLRAPQIGTPFPQPARQVSPGRAAAAIGAAAAISIGGGTAVISNGYNAPATQQQQTPITRTALPGTPSSLNPLLQGATAAKAPSIGAMLPSAATNLPSAAGGAPPLRAAGMGVAGLLAGAIPGLIGSGINSNPALQNFGIPIPGGKNFRPFNTSDRAASQAKLDAAGDAAKSQVGNSLKNLADDLFRRPGRKGDKDPNARKDDQEAFKPYVPGVKYSGVVDLKNKFLGGDETGFGFVTFDNIAGNGGGVTHDNQRVYFGGTLILDIADGRRELTNTSLRSINAPPGTPVPQPTFNPPQAGTPFLGLSLPDALGGLPILGVTAAASPSSPSNRLPSTPNSPTKPSDRPQNPTSAPPKAEPTKPGGEAAPNVPTVTPPAAAPTSTPGQGSPSATASLAPVTNAPVNGSASINAPLLPSIYTPNPGVRNPEAFQPPKAAEPEAKAPELQPDSCCQKTGDGLDAIKKVLGVGEFPAMLPILTGDNNVTVNNIPELLMWNTTNTDSVAGLFPATVKVVQADSSEKEFKLQNIAHAFEELFAAVLTMSEDADAAVNIGARIATEVVQTKIAVHQGNDLLKALQKFLGFAVAPAARLIKLNFSPTATGLNGKLENDEMVGFLKPSAQSYVGSDLHEKQEVLPMLQRILNNSEIARLAVWHPIKPNPKDGDNITGTKLRERRTKPTPAEKATWEAQLKRLKELGVEIDDNSPNKGTTK